MTDNEIKLLNLIRNASDPERAMAIVEALMTNYLGESQPFGATSPECSQGHF